MLCSVIYVGTASAVNLDVSGFVRQEASLKLTSKNSIFNQQGNPYNGTTGGSGLTRPDFDQDNDWNLMATRAEIDLAIAIDDHWSGFVKVRGYFNNNPLHNYEDPNFFEVPFFGDCGGRLEVCGEDYMVDLPSAYLDYNNGPLWIRFGNQQIAWGEAIFFRVTDVVNGLDLRRHSFFDWASEEYADERIASPAIRASYRITNQWELGGFAQMFSPTIMANENTPYNVISSQFVIQQEQSFDDVDNDWNFGLRLSGQFDDLGLQFFAVSRRNPDGVYSWTTSNKSFLAATPFEQDQAGIYSSAEWFTYAAASRLDGITAYNTANNLAGPQAFLTTRAQVAAALDGTFGALGPLRGHLDREYLYENIFGWSMNYLFTAEPDSLLDQLIVRFEMSFTPDKKFTNPDLSRNFIEADETALSLVFEKYHRFSASFPATYMVFEYMYKSESDMFGRHLSGNDNDGVAKGDDGFHALAFAMQQPSPTLEWRFDLAVLYDLKGGFFLQPGVRWKPNREMTVETFVNIFHSDGGNDDIIETIEDSDELGVRYSYQF